MVATVSKSRKSNKVQKQVQVIARYVIRRNGHVIYTVRSSNGVDQYQVLVIEGVVQSCSCPSHTHCYHKRGIQIMEENRREQGATPALSTVLVDEAMAEAQQAMVQFDRDADPNAYEVLAPTKQVRRLSEAEETARCHREIFYAEW